MLKEWKIWSFANTKMMKPTNRDGLEEHEALEARAQRVILDGVKDHLIQHLAKKKTPNYMWNILKELFESKNENQKMAFKDKLHNVKITKDESVNRVAQFKDELGTLGETISNLELVRILVKGFTKK